MAFKSVIPFLFISCFVAISISLARETPRKLSGDQTISELITSRLIEPNNNNNNGTTSAVDCWNALREIRSCSNEIANYFANGTSDIGPKCCEAIDVITHNCWPKILDILGFTADQTYILRGYCDASLISSSFGPVQGPSA